MNQAELELETLQEGRARAESRIKDNEAKGQAAMNPYANAVHRRFVLPMIELIGQALRSTGKPGRRAAHVPLIAPLNAEVTAYVAVRTLLTEVMAGDRQRDYRSIISKLGANVYHEYLLEHFADVEPELFYRLVQDFERRQAGMDHRVTVFKMQARKAGVEWVEWGAPEKHQVGAFLLELLCQVGLCYVEHRHMGREKFKGEVHLVEEVRELLAAISEFSIETLPLVTPCIEPPVPWTSVAEGGYHTVEMRRRHPTCVVSAYTKELSQEDMPVVLKAINKLQRVGWRINKRVMDFVTEAAQKIDIGDDVVAAVAPEKPPAPEWLAPDMTKEDMDNEQLAQFIAWKRRVAEWHDSNKIRSSRQDRSYLALRMARKFVGYDELFFVYYADFRGRLYPKTVGINPQGSDLQKALLEFSEGKPLLDDAARRWFKITGANLFGFDKASLEDRAKWVDDRKAMILRCAADPLSYRDWLDADCPLQFLAWCFEYADWQAQGDEFLSRIAVGMDGSCNGLQNFSAMLRDEVGGRATNLLPGPLPNDIYKMVAEETATLLSAASVDDPDKEAIRIDWLRHGMNRSIVKRSVMTLPYGSTRFSCADFILKDYLRKGSAKEFDKDRQAPAAQYLSVLVWQAIGMVVVKAKEAMQFLQQCACIIINSGERRIEWRTPSGFRVLQRYQKRKMLRIKTKLMGEIRLAVYEETPEPDVRRHKNGIAPNFVHSMDASHLHLVTVAADDAGISSLAMIHDDYGTHAADAQKLYTLIREVFVDMYSNSQPLAEFASRYSKYNLPAIPSSGSLDLELVKESTYFFS